MPTPPPDQVHFQTCTLCEAMCGLRVEVDGGQVTSIRGDDEDPFSRGHICPKAVALKDLHEDPDRLRHPVRRTANGWEKVSWDDALDETAERLHRVQREHGRDAVAMYLGNPTVHNHGAVLYGLMFLRALRTKNRYSATSVDQLPHQFAAYQMLGHQLLLPIPDIDRTRYFLVLGANPLVSNGSLMTAPDMRGRIKALQQRGGKLVVVDPRKTETARAADEHLFIRPGTDALLLLSLLHVAFEKGPRLGRLADFTDGVETLRAVARDFPPERAALHTGIPAETIRRIANDFASAESAVCYGRIGASQQAFGGLCLWLINALNLVTGNFDREGGAMFTRPAVDALDAPRAMAVSAGHYDRYRSRVRGLPEFAGELPVAVLGEEILTEGPGRVRGLVTSAGNPVLSTPNGAQLDRALSTLDFMVSIDPYINETTRHAHLILPPTSPLERSHYDLIFHLLAVRNTAKYSPALFAPPPGALHDWQIHLELYRRLKKLRGGGLRDRLEYEALKRLGPDGMVDLALRVGPYGALRGGLSLAKLRREAHGVDLGPLKPCLPGRLPKGRKRINAAPAPLVDDVKRLREAFPETAAPRNGELLLIGRRGLRDNNSWMHNVSKLVSGKPRCTLLMHPEDAKARGLAEGQDAVVTSRVGQITVPVTVTEDVMPGVVSLPHGYGHARDGVRLRVAAENAGVSLNDLTDDRAVDALSGNAALSGVPVQVAPSQPSADRQSLGPRI